LPHHYAKCALQTHTHRIAAAATPSLQLPDGYKSVHITSAYLHHYSIECLVTPANVGMKDPFEMVVLAGSIQEAMSDSAHVLYRKTAIEFDGVIKKHSGRTALLWLPAVVKPNPLAESDMFGKTQDMMLSVGNEMGLSLSRWGWPTRKPTGNAQTSSCRWITTAATRPSRVNILLRRGLRQPLWQDVGRQSLRLLWRARQGHEALRAEGCRPDGAEVLRARIGRATRRTRDEAGD
jgi:hypothetical protein